ncbi:hypothetical protein HHI36_017084 [Cryptolaemus montrouzieri]|uniref:Uncharacterized protein n=1 Tax=Cryptolaemus montrouzieri TaxID=559131 RepID=A0ABD2NLK2_9CUCU
MPDYVCNIPGYLFYRCDSTTTPGYAGCCIFISELVMENHTVGSHSIAILGNDNIFLDIESPTFSICVECIYRPRACVHDSLLFDHLENVSNSKQTVLFAEYQPPVREWDHVVLNMKIQFHETPNCSNNVKKIEITNYQRVSGALQLVDWNELWNPDDVNDM